MNLKDIWHSLNLKNNKIINAKTDTPTHDDHLVPKIFVDKRTIYNTPKVLEYINPFKLDWVKDPGNKTILDIFDDVFFPQINPEYVNPKFNTFTTKKTGTNLVFIDTINTGFKVKWNIDQSDRILNQVPQIIITKNDNSITSFSADNTELIGEKTFNVEYVNISKIEFIAVFNPTTVVKQDSYGNDFIPDDFLTVYSLKHNILNDIISDNNIVPAILYRKIQLNENVETIVNQTLTINTMVDLVATMNYVKTNKDIIVTGNVNNFNVLLIPKIVYDEYLMFIGIDNIPGSVLSRNQLTTIDGIQFYIKTIDLGYYSNQTVLELKFQRNN